MKIEFDPSQEGACLLYDCLAKKAIIGVSPQCIIKDLDKAKRAMGYLAYPGPGLKNDIPDQLFYEYEDIVTDDKFHPATETKYRTSGKLEESFSKEEYIEKIEAIKELLAAGEVYQVNFAIRFRKKFSGDSYAMFCKLSKSNPVAFSAYFNAGKFQIISSSPERLLKVEKGMIVTEPIKGTAKKKDLDYLLESEKERAELDMITDLERNDVGRICEFGTLKLTKERELLELKNLWHTYSQVEGKLGSDVTREDVIEAMFPGGSITGCPKKRAMRYISGLEGIPRNIYTGSIGYIDTDKMDFNIAIRTILIKGGFMEFWAGGGIVADSDPEKEYEEALLKAERFLGII